MPGSGDGTFQGPVVVTSPGGGVGVFSAGTADFNGDEIPDLFVSQACVPGSYPAQCGAGVLLGKPDSTYQSPTVAQSSGQSSQYSLSADFNGDGKPDLAILNACDSPTSCNSPSVSILLGTGDGTFQPPVTYPLGGSTPVGIVTGDFNGDMKLDIAVATQCDSSSCTQGTVSILLGNGDGTFQNAATTGIGSGVAVSIAAGDFDRDGKSDVVVGNTNASINNPYAEFATILLSNGDGTLRVAGSYDTGGAATPNGVRAVIAVTGDINHDGNLDVVVANGCEAPIQNDAGCSNGSMGVLLGNGDGTFQQVQETVVTDGNLISASLVDVDGDGNLDLIASTAGGVMVARGKGDGTFQPPVIYGGLAEPTNVVLAVADLNNDGAPDIVQPDNGGNLAIFYNRGGTFLTTVTSGSPSIAGLPVTFTTTVTASIAKNLTATGTISFYDGTVFLGTVSILNGAASLTLSSLSVGTHTIISSYSGDPNFNPHNGPSLAQIVTSTLVSTQVTLTSSPNPSNAGQLVIFTAIVTATGNIQFYDNGVAIGTAGLNASGQAVFSTASLSQGTHSISANYGGDAGHSSSTSPTLYQSVVTVPSGAFLYGVVTDRGSGQPLAGVSVRLCVPANIMLYGGLCTFLTTTDASGTYSLSGTLVTSSSGGLLFQGQGYYANLQPYTIVSVPTQVDASLLLGGTILQGSVTDASTQQGIVGATVSFYPDSSLTSADGGFSIQVLTGAVGAYTVDSSHFMEAAAGGFKMDSGALYAYVSAPGYLTLPTAGLTASPPFPTVQNYSLIPSGATALQGTVTDRSTGAMLAGVRVKLCVPASILLYGGSCSSLTTTDANGHYSLSGAQATSASGGLLFQLPSYYANLQSFTITSLPTQLDASLLVGGTILQGTVTDASTQQGIVGATVSLSPDSSLTSADGGFTIQVLTGALGAYAVDSSHFMEAAAGGFKVDGTSATAPGYLTLPAGGFLASPPYPIAQNYSLIPTGATALQGTVTDRGTGTALAGVSVKLCVPATTLLYGGSCSFVATTDGSGHYSLSGAQATSSSGGLLFQLQGYYANLQSFTISSVPTQLDASLLTGGTILQGTVTDASTQQGVVGATVSFYPDSSLISAEGGLANTIHVLTATLGAYAVDSSHFMEAAVSGFKVDGGASFAYVSAPGYLTLPTAGFTATPPFPLTENYSVIPNGTTNLITMNTAPGGLTFMVDGINYTAQQSFQWPTGSVHSIVTTSLQGTGGTRYLFAQWSDGGAQSHQVTIIGAANYTASFGIQHQLTTTASPTGGGSVTAGGWFNSGASVTITATANSGFTFTGFTGDLSGSTNPQTLVMSAPRNVTANFAAAQFSTATSLISSANPAVYLQPVNFTATVGSSSGTPAGTVSFYAGSALIGSAILTNGVGTSSVAFPTVGPYSITAIYGGDATHTSSTSSALIETVNKASTTTSVTSSKNPQLIGQPITFTAAISGQFGGAVSGSVVFKAGASTLGTVAVSGNQASLTTSFATAGTRSITAQYAGDTNDTGSASPALSESVVAKLATTTTVASSVNPSYIGQAVKLTATVTSSGGTPPDGEVINFRQGTTVLASVPMLGGTASFTTSSLTVGTHNLNANYGGDATFNASTSAPALAQVVAKYPTSTALTSSLNPSIYGQSVTLSATVSSTNPNSATGTVTFRNGSTGMGTVTLTSGIATLTRTNLTSGTLSITATYNGDASSAVSTSAPLGQIMNLATTTTRVVSSRNPSNFGQSVRFTATVTSATVTPTGTVTFSSGATVLGTVNLAGGRASLAATTLPRGTNTITATYSGTANISGSSGTVAQVVN
ncbi:MAG: hypothetical protein AUG83_02945 [Acidobacteria bacterium 13_1_20CM_4_57_11]|nr:MAG: hypothetical protein AUG83_02945 [Acidobacteria bacterium 13_1_20CM_4_57_11]